MHYIVLGGGVSPEKEVSQRSAAEVQRALERLGHSVIYRDPALTSLEEILREAAASDGIFPILHGAGGEDGTLQKSFEEHNLPFFGPDALACSSTFDKIAFKKILEQHTITTPRWNVVNVSTFETEPLTTQPFVLKPFDGGSSIDTFIVTSLPFDPAPMREALARYETMLIEEYIAGTEITVGILEGEALPVVEIIPPKDQVFDYENKYNGATKELCPPLNVSAEQQEKAKQLALQVHEVTNCRHISRTDILINEAGDMFVIDTNTIPGLTSQSLYPKAAAAAGYSWESLVKRFAGMLAS